MAVLLQVVPVGYLGRTASRSAHVRMVASAHHLGVCVLADGLGLTAHIERVRELCIHVKCRVECNIKHCVYSQMYVYIVCVCV